MLEVDTLLDSLVDTLVAADMVAKVLQLRLHLLQLHDKTSFKPSRVQEIVSEAEHKADWTEDAWPYS